MAELPENSESLLRKKPIVFAVGLEKCGTTSLNNLLAQATNVSSPWPKELRYFSSQYGKGEQWFLSHHDTSKEILADFTPTYHRKEEALLRIRADCERKAIIVLLRHPVERAYSAYNHTKYCFFFKRDFNVAKKAVAHGKPFADLIGKNKPFLFPSYTQLIDRIYATFDRSIVTIIPMEHLLGDVGSCLRSIEKTLDCAIDVDHGKKLPRSNVLYMPQFFTGRELLDMEPGAADLIQDIDATYIVRGGMPKKIAGGDTFRSFKKMEENWMQPMTADAAAKAFARYYQAETAQIEEALEVNLDKWRVFRDCTPRTIKPFSEEAARANVNAGIWYVQHLFKKKKMPERALSLLREILADQPTDPRIHHCLAGMLFRTGDQEGARHHSSMAVQLAPRVPRFTALRARIS
jgi:hypothetical protein